MTTKRQYFQQWQQQGKILSADLTRALLATELYPSGEKWRQFLDRLLLWLSALALTISVIFFIAYNWQDLGRFAKFGLIELLVLSVLLFYARQDSDKPAAKVLLTVASLLVGVLLAFFGQTYQTGADPWQLFANWGLFILPWVVVGQFAALWLLWAAILNTAIIAYFHTFGGLFWFFFGGSDTLIWLLILFNGLLWSVWELLTQRFSWLNARWAIRTLALVTGGCLTSLVIWGIFDKVVWEPLLFIGYLSWLLGLFLFYRHTRFDLFMLAGLSLSFIVVATTFIAHQMSDLPDEVTLLLLSLLVIALSGMAANWLRAIAREHQA